MARVSSCFISQAVPWLHTQAPTRLDRVDPAPAPRQVVDGREPGGERQLGVLEDGARRQPQLLLAAVALGQLAGPELAGAAAGASGAGQALPPAHPEQRPPAGSSVPNRSRNSISP